MQTDYDAKYTYNEVLDDDYIDHIVVKEMQNLYDYGVDSGDAPLCAAADEVLRFYCTSLAYNYWLQNRQPFELKDTDYGN